MKPVKLEVLKFGLVSEEEVLYIPDTGSDGPIVVDNDWVVSLSDNHKERGNLFCILFKLLFPVGENKGDCPGVYPVCL